MPAKIPNAPHGLYKRVKRSSFGMLMLKILLKNVFADLVKNIPINAVIK